MDERQFARRGEMGGRPVMSSLPQRVQTQAQTSVVSNSTPEENQRQNASSGNAGVSCGGGMRGETMVRTGGFYSQGSETPRVGEVRYRPFGN